MFDFFIWQIAYLFDNAATVLYAVFVSFWGKFIIASCNRPFSARDHMVQNNPNWNAKKSAILH